MKREPILQPNKETGTHLTPTEVKNGRNSAVESLRILAMILIIASHYTVHGGVDKISLLADGYWLNAWYLQVTTLGNLGVDIFVMIFGYYGIKSRFTWEKLGKLVLQVFTYSALFYLLFVLFGLEPFTIGRTVKALFPTISKQYWFFTAYIALFIVSPYLNRVLRSADKKQLEHFIFTILILWCLLPTFTTGDMYGSELPQFLLLYSLGAYLRLYPEEKWNTKRFGLLLAGAAFCLMLLSSAVLDYLGQYCDLLWDHVTHFFARTSLLVVACTMGLLIFFSKIKPFYNPTINLVASLAFGVYLFHDNNYVRPFLWKNLLRNAEWAETPYLIPHQICSVLGVFLVGVLIEYLRQKLIEPLYWKPIHRWFQAHQKNT